MSKPKFNPTTNELVDSVFFNENKEEVSNRTVERSNDRSNVRDLEPTVETNIEEAKQTSSVEIAEPLNESTYDSPVERYGVRESFEIYKDQQESLDRIIRHRWESEKKRPIKSAMIREALDVYLRKELKRLGIRP